MAGKATGHGESESWPLVGLIVVYQALKSLETGDTAPLQYFHPEHNVHAADGIAGVRVTLELLAYLPTKVSPQR